MELLNQRWIVALMARLLRTWVRLKRLVLSSPSPAADDDGSSSPEQMVQHMFEGLLAEDPHDTEHLQFRHFQRVLPGFDQSSFDAVLRLTDSDPELGVSLDALLTIYLELELSDLRADYASYLRTDVEDVPALELETEAALEDPWSIDYDALGWHPRLPCHYNDPDVGALREQLRAHGGCGMIADQTGHVEPIEIVDPVVPGYGARAAELLRRDGYVVIKDVLDEQRLQTVRQGVERVVRQIVARDPDRLGNRGSHRYTFGPACEAFGEHAAWAPLVDPPALMEVLRHIFGEEEYLCGGCGGGDFCLPGALEFQHLHSDGAAQQDGKYGDGKLGTRDADGSTFYHKDVDAPEIDGCTYKIVNYRDIDVSHTGITVNYPMEVGGPEPGGQDADNGATRQIRGTHSTHEPIVKFSEEPLSMKLSMVAPCPAGCALIRDNRAWHGGCPNLSKYVRAIPSASFSCPARSIADRDAIKPRSSEVGRIPHKVYSSLSPIGQKICAGLEAAAGEEVERPRFGGGIEAWGWMHTEEGFKKDFPQPALAKL